MCGLLWIRFRKYREEGRPNKDTDTEVRSETHPRRKLPEPHVHLIFFFKRDPIRWDPSAAGLSRTIYHIILSVTILQSGSRTTGHFPCADAKSSKSPTRSKTGATRRVNLSDVYLSGFQEHDSKLMSMSMMREFNFCDSDLTQGQKR